MPGLDPAKGLSTAFSGDQAAGLPFGPGDLNSLLQQPALGSLKAPQDSLQASGQPKPP